MKTMLQKVGIAALVAGAMCVSMPATKADTTYNIMNLVNNVGGISGFNNTGIHVRNDKFDLSGKDDKSAGTVNRIASRDSATVTSRDKGVSISANIDSYLPGQTIDFHLNYQMTALDAGDTITGGFLGLSNFYPVTGTGKIVATDTYYTDSSMTTPLGAEHLIIDITTPLSGYVGGWVSTGSGSVYVEKDIQFKVIGAGPGEVAGSEIIQNVVPEPASIGILALLGGGLMGWRRLRRWGA